MRRILNLNQPGVLFLKIIGLFVVVVPAILYWTILLGKSAAISQILHSWIKGSLAIGACVFVVLLVLIIVEQIQDRNFDVQYQKNRDQKLPLANGDYECQYCGNRQVKASDKTCQVCGRELKQDKERSRSEV